MALKLHVYVEWIANFPPILHVVPIQTCFWVISCNSVVYWSALNCRLLLPPLCVWVEKQRKNTLLLFWSFLPRKTEVTLRLFYFSNFYIIISSCVTLFMWISRRTLHLNFTWTILQVKKNTFEIYTKTTFNVKFTEIKLMCLSRILADSLENVHVKFPYGDLPYARLW